MKNEILILIIMGGLILSAGCVTGMAGIVGKEPTWRIVSVEEAKELGAYDKDQCYGLGIESQYVYSCPAVIQTIVGDPCLDYTSVLHYNELDNCVQMECVMVQTPDNQLCQMYRELYGSHYNPGFNASVINTSVERAIFENTSSVVRTLT